MCVARRKSFSHAHRRFPTAYNRLGNNPSSAVSSSSTIDDLTGDPFSIYFIPTGQKSGTDPFQWKHHKEGLALHEEKTMVIEKLQNM